MVPHEKKKKEPVNVKLDVLSLVPHTFPVDHVFQKLCIEMPHLLEAPSHVKALGSFE